MDLVAAIGAVASPAPTDVIDGLTSARLRLEEIGVLSNKLRAAHMIGQCAHESMRFTRRVESLFYSSGDRIFAVFGRRHFQSIAEAEQFARNQEKLANHVYANRLGNGPEGSGDGFRYRGRGYLQLTGRDNYRIFGKRLGLPLESDPEIAAQPTNAWLIAACFLATRSRAGKTALEWADQNNVEMVTRIVNGGILGLADRRDLTARASAALGAIEHHSTLERGAEGSAVLLLQRLLAENGFSPGALDGDFGPKTEQALREFQSHVGLQPTGRADEPAWHSLESVQR